MPDNPISLREYFENKLIELDKRYEQRFTSQERALQVSVENTNKALDAAKNAQDGVNNKGNEFRSSLEDYQKHMISRSEAASEFSRLKESIERNNASIIALQLGQSKGFGQEEAVKSSQMQKNWQIGISVVIGIFIAGSVVTLIYFLLQNK